MSSSIGASELRVMTWNVRNGGDDPGHQWTDRRTLIAEVLAEVDPDVVCVQEAFHDQLDDLLGMLPDHEVVGRGRDADPDAGEFTALLLRRARLEVVDSGFFWLSDTPDVPASITWGNSLTRIAVWARCVDRDTGHDLAMAGAHVDHEPGDAGDRVRRLGTALIGDRLAALPDPVLVLGDYNEDIAHGSFAELESRGFRDLWASAVSHSGAVGTFHGYTDPIPNGDRIDWILARGDVSARDIRILHDGDRMIVASDHFPVVADLALAD